MMKTVEWHFESYVFQDGLLFVTVLAVYLICHAHVYALYALYCMCTYMSVPEFEGYL